MSERICADCGTAAARNGLALRCIPCQRRRDYENGVRSSVRVVLKALREVGAYDAPEGVEEAIVAKRLHV